MPLDWNSQTLTFLCARKAVLIVSVVLRVKDNYGVGLICCEGKLYTPLAAPL